PAYAVIARRRIAEVSPAASEALALESRREAPRIPFGNLIERGLIRPGEVLFDQTRRHQARVRADGSLISAEHRGSIHSVGALVQGAPACNGWAFWYVQRNGQPLPIDSLRQLVRTELEPPGRRAERAINRALTTLPPIVDPRGMHQWGPGAGCSTAANSGAFARRRSGDRCRARRALYQEQWARLCRPLLPYAGLALAGAERE